MKKKKLNLVEILIIISIFMFSLIIGSKYIGGDQKYYREAYSQLKTYSFEKGYIYYSISLHSFEFIHYIIVWCLSRILPKDVIMSIFNALLGLISYKILRKWGANRFNALYIIFLNYYFLVLYFAAERLKFGFLIFGIAILFKNKKVRNYILSLSILAHIQMIILLIAIKIQKYIKSLIKTVMKLKFTISILLSIILTFIIIILMSKQFVVKIQNYALQNTNILDIIKIMVFFIFSYWFSSSKKKVLYMYFPIIVATVIVGSFRTTIFAYILMLYFCISNKKGNNIAILSTNIYYTIMSINFITLIIKYGRAFLN